MIVESPLGDRGQLHWNNPDWDPISQRGFRDPKVYQLYQGSPIQSQDMILLIQSMAIPGT